MSDIHSISYKDSKSVTANPDKYMRVMLDTAKVLKSWRASIYSFEWLGKEGGIKPIEGLSEAEQAKRHEVEKTLKEKEVLGRPVLGIGMMGTIEIGTGRAVLLILIDKGVKEIEAHIPKSCEEDFKKYRVDL